MDQQLELSKNAGLSLGFSESTQQKDNTDHSKDNELERAVHDDTVPLGDNLEANKSDNSNVAIDQEKPFSEPWPPLPPDVSFEEIFPHVGKKIDPASLGSVVHWQGLALKINAFQHEFDMIMKAGDCAVTPVGRAIGKVEGRPVMRGLLMEVETPFKVATIASTEKPAFKREMIRLVCKLHEQYKMVHGDIKPSNFLRCKDGSLRLCDFDSARLMDADAAEWEGNVTEEFLAPNRKFFETGQAPKPVDDIYALGLSIWSLYTGKEVLAGMDMEELLKDGRTVDLDEIEDMETRWFVRICLQLGGALV